MKKLKGSPFSKHIEVLSKISQTIVSDLYLEDILKLIVMVTAEVMNSKICSLMLLDDEKKELSVRATQSVSEAYNKKPNVKLGEGVAGIVALENRPITILDVKSDPLYRNKDIARNEKLSSLLSIPLSVKGKVTGVLNTYTSKPHKFTKEEIALLSTVANQAAIVIENARLITKSKLVEEELQTRKLIERAKGILMNSLSIPEPEAFNKIQKQAMNMRKTMREIAEAIILSKQITS
jgi:signal transduction protein with GAF and PtsI domain